MRQGLQSIKKFIPEQMKRLIWHRSKSILASLVYGFPARQLKIIGVTGTDGKTTTSTLIYEILNKAGISAGLVSTVSFKYGKIENSTGLHVTSPEPFKLQKLLRKMKQAGVELVVLETTSHGLIQERFWGIGFEVGVLTNVTREHLDYHKTMDRYLAAKSRLFENSEMVVLNADDPSWRFFKDRLTDNRKLVTYGLKNKADYTPQSFEFKTSLLGEFNQSNCLAAIAATSLLGIKSKLIRQAINDFRGVRGRLQLVPNKHGFKVYVDFAHTPNALEQVLKTLRKETKKRLIVVDRKSVV